MPPSEPQTTSVSSTMLEKYGRMDAKFLSLVGKHDALVDELLAAGPDKVRALVAILRDKVPYDADLADSLYPRSTGRTYLRGTFSRWLSNPKTPVPQLAMYCVLAGKASVGMMLAELDELCDRQLEIGTNLVEVLAALTEYPNLHALARTGSDKLEATMQKVRELQGGK